MYSTTAIPETSTPTWSGSQPNRGNYCKSCGDLPCVGMSGVEIRKQTPLADLDLSILSCSARSLCEIEAMACSAGIDAWESMCQLHALVQALSNCLHRRI